MKLKLKESITVEKGAVYQPGNLLFSQAYSVYECRGFSNVEIGGTGWPSPNFVYHIAWDGRNLLVVFSSTRYVHKCHGLTNTITDSIYLSSPVCDLAWCGNNLCVAHRDINEIRVYRGFSNTPIKQIYLPDARSCACDPGRLYSAQCVDEYCENSRYNKHYGFTGTIADSFTIRCAGDITWDGENLIIVCGGAQEIRQQDGFSDRTKYVRGPVGGVGGYIHGVAWKYFMGAPRARFISRLFPVQDGVRCSYPRSGYCVIVSFD